MGSYIFIVIIACEVFFIVNCQKLIKPIDLLNTCLDSENHKSKPGPEANIFNQCQPWKEHSCCTAETSVKIHHTDMYNFTYNHCFEQTGKNMSDECRRHFNQDMCFFECEPHIGPWKVNVKRKFANERFYQVPLCASDCDSWFKACRFDYTCVTNWPRGMNFSKGVNRCPNNAQCLTFDKIYGDAKTFCQQVWDHSWVYTPDNQNCMRVWFNGSQFNPNERAAQIKIREMIRNAPGSAQSLQSSLSILIVSVILIARFVLL